MTKKEYKTPEMRVIKLQPAQMLAQSGGAVKSVVNGEGFTGEGFKWGNDPGYDR